MQSCEVCPCATTPKTESSEIACGTHVTSTNTVFHRCWGRLRINLHFFIKSCPNKSENHGEENMAQKKQVRDHTEGKTKRTPPRKKTTQKKTQEKKRKEHSETSHPRTPLKGTKPPRTKRRRQPKRVPKRDFHPKRVPNPERWTRPASAVFTRRAAERC